MIIELLVLLTALEAGIFLAIMDTVGNKSKFDESIFSGIYDSYFDSSISWHNKWKIIQVLNLPKWVEPLISIFSDCWHQVKFLFLIWFSLSCVLIGKLNLGFFITTFLIIFLVSSVFLVFYHFLLRKKFWNIDN